MKSQTWKVWIAIATLLTCLMSSELSAQDRKGKRLFEKEWSWDGPAQATPNPERVVRVMSLAPFPTGGGDGLGPLFNAKSCNACHPGGGASGVEHNVTLITVEPRSEFFKKPSTDIVMEFFPGLLSGVGISFNTVVHDHSTRPGYEPIREGLRTHVATEVADDWFVPSARTVEAVAKTPVQAGRFKTIDYYLSQRNTPALFGLGLIESISTVHMEHVAKRQPEMTDGRVTGRIAGKFGWRGQVSTLNQFIVGACAGELGLNQSVSATQANDPADPKYVSAFADIKPEEIAYLQGYVSDLPKPTEVIPEGHTRAEVRAGEKLFNSVGCAVCHVPDLRPTTGMFSDLLLHDMGPELQAPFPAPSELMDVKRINAPRLENPFGTTSAPAYYGSPGQTSPPIAYPTTEPETPQFPRGKLLSEEHEQSNAHWDAMAREWKTPPLWGVADTAPYLHDGRAATLHEAIVWHGGEGEDARNTYKQLSNEEQQKVVLFLSSLRAPFPVE